MIRRRILALAVGQSLALAALAACSTPTPSPPPPPSVAVGRAPTPLPPAVRPPSAPLARPSQGPNVFGSTAIRISQTILDSKWRDVSGGIDALPRTWAATLDRAGSVYGVERLRLINSFVNRNVAQVTDRSLYGQADVWANVERTAAKGRGDCEDYAIAKMQMLRAVGVAAEDMYLVVVNDLVRRQDHAVLMVAHEDRFYVLDSNTDRLMLAEDVKDYRPILTYSAERAWIHGFRQQPADIRLAQTMSPGGR